MVEPSASSVPPVGVGIAGLGRSGWNIHAAAIADHSGFDVRAVADPVEERRDEAKERFDCATFPDPEPVLSQDDVDVVVVATPSYNHVTLTLAALGHGKHVVVEKPMAATAAEVDQMIAAARKAERVLTCYQPRRFDADFALVRDTIASGRLGDLLLIRRTAHRFTRRADWQTLRKFGGGELSNTVPHPLDQVLALLGDGGVDDVDVFADLRHTVGLGDAEDHVKLFLRPGDGQGPAADIESSLCVALPQPAWQVFGTRGALVVDGNTATVRWLDPATLGELELDEGPAAGRRYGTGEQLDWQEETQSIGRPERSQALQFYDLLAESVQRGAPAPVDPRSTRRQVAIIEEARAQTGYA